MKEQINPLIEQMRKEIRKVIDKLFETEHQIIQKDIEIATLTLELGLQKKAYALLRQSYSYLLKKQSDDSQTPE
jgi:septum formation topological specificity factor MinE